MPAYLLHRAGRIPLAPVWLSNVIAQLGSSEMDIVTTEYTDAANYPFLCCNGKGKRIFRVRRQHRQDVVLCVCGGIGIWQTVPQVVQNLEVIQILGQGVFILQPPLPYQAIHRKHLTIFGQYTTFSRFGQQTSIPRCGLRRGERIRLCDSV